MRIAVCDDDPLEQKQIIQALWGWDPTPQAELFSDGASLLEAARVSPFSIAFLDIYLPGEDGIDIAKSLREISPETGIVFVTVSKEHAIDAFSLAALHYLVKPVTTEQITEAFRRLTMLHIKRRETISFTVGRDSYTIFLDQICCLESARHAVEVLLTDGRRLKVWLSLNDLGEKLGDGFLKTNRGTLVNMDHIEQMGRDTCVLRDGTRLVISKQRRSAVREIYNDYLFSKLSCEEGIDRMG